MQSSYLLKVTKEEDIAELKKLSTESLIIWIIGKGKEKGLKLSPEDIVLECWFVNPDKHSMRGYPQYPDSSVVVKRIGEMKGKKGLLSGSEMNGYELTEISKLKYADINARVLQKKVIQNKGAKVADRKISSIDEAPYIRLTKTPAYQKYISNKTEQIVETDFLYFYGINWHNKKSFIISRIKNVDKVVEDFTTKNVKLKQVRDYMTEKFKQTKEYLINKV